MDPSPSTIALLETVGAVECYHAVEELQEGGLNLEQFNDRLNGFTAGVESNEFQSNYESNEASLTSFLFCFSSAKKKSNLQRQQQQNENVSRKRDEPTMIESKPIAEWSAKWVAEGRIALAECSAEEKAEKAKLYMPFDISCLDELVKYCLYKQSMAEYAAQMKWAYFGYDFIVNCVKEAQQSDFKQRCSWAFITGCMLHMNRPQSLIALKRSDNPSERMAEEARLMDAADPQYAVNCLLELNDTIHLANGKTESSAEKYKSIFTDKNLVSRKLRLVVSSLWLAFRYYLPRHLTYTTTRQSIPRHSQWNELIDCLVSDIMVSFVDSVCPELLTYFYVLTAVLRRRSDLNDPVVARASLAAQNGCPYAKLLIALTTTNFEVVNTLMVTVEKNMANDFLMGPIAQELIEQFRIGAFETYYRIHRSIDHDGMLTTLDVKMLGSRMRGNDSTEPTMSGDSQQLLVRSSYLINTLEKESAKFLTSQGQNM